MTDTTQLDLVVAANFTAEPVDASLGFCLRALRLPATVQHAPYDQVFQQLLDPSSILRRNAAGIGLVLVRLQNFLETEQAPEGSAAQTSPDDMARELVHAVSAALKDSAGQLIICFCPATGLDAERSQAIARAEEAAAEALRDEGGVRVLTSTSLLERYPCAQIADEQGERLAAIPYTPSFFSVLGTALARSIYALAFPAHKVLVLDCDDTLWGGLCSELGPQGVTLSEEHLALQRFAVAQRDDGKLICLASRNNEADVLAVFDQNPSMVLKRDDLTAWQIHWGLKSDSLAELAGKLGLGLSSFVFMDDDPVQCAEVQRRFPEVLALPVPREDVGEYCRHIWPLDPRSSTSEGSRRTGAYREHVAREDVRASSQSFQEFLNSLELDVQIEPLREQDLGRATELTFRTNQFNLTGQRLKEAELRALLQDGSRPCFVVRVRDRFGDYGLVGLVVAQRAGDELQVPLMLLSCRALGRGVEYRMVAHLGHLARELGAQHLALHCVPAERNDPAQEFLHTLGDLHCDAKGTLHLKLDSHAAEAVQLNLDAAPRQAQAPVSDTVDTDLAALPDNPADGSAKRSVDDTQARVAFLAGIPLSMASEAAIHAAIHDNAPGTTNMVAGGDAGSPAAASAVETRLREAFAGQLAIDPVPEEEGFFELGGDSLQAMQILAQLSGEFGVELDPSLLFTTNFTISELAGEIEFLREGPDPEETGISGSLSAASTQ
jgi:FkbH-like protein